MEVNNDNNLLDNIEDSTTFNDLLKKDLEANSISNNNFAGKPINYKNVVFNVLLSATFLLSSAALIVSIVNSNKTNQSTYNSLNYDIQGGYNLALKYESFGQRNAGTEEAKESRTWIEEYANYWGYSYDEFKFDFPVSSRDYRYVPGENVTAQGTNIVFEKQGRSEETILVSAHYDSNPALFGTDGMAFTDNGSGVAIVLELAQTLSYYKTQDLPYTIRFGLWDAEEHGEYGSQAYAEWLTTQPNNDNVIMDINLDTPVGGNYTYLEAPGQGVPVAGADTGGVSLSNVPGYAVSAGLRNAIQDAALAEGYPTYTTPSWSHRDNDPVNPNAINPSDPSYGMIGENESQNCHLYGNGFNYTTAYTGTESGYAGEGYPASDWVAFMENGIPCVGIESTNYRIDYGWNSLGDGYPQLYEAGAWKLMTEQDFVSYWSDVANSYSNLDDIPTNRLWDETSFSLSPWSGYGFTDDGKNVDFGKDDGTGNFVFDEANLTTNLETYYLAEVAGYQDSTLQIDNPTGQPYPYELALQNGDYRPGSTWHTQNDNSSWYEANVGRENLTAQFTMITDVLLEFLLNADTYLAPYSTDDPSDELGGLAANTNSNINYSWDHVNP